jgi:hypothetical protein
LIELLGRLSPPFVHNGAANHEVERASGRQASVAGLIDVENMHTKKKGG